MLLRNARRYALVVNDLAEADLDAETLERLHAVPEEAVLNLAGSALGPEHAPVLRESVRRWEGEGRTHVLLETSGAADPQAVLDLLHEVPELALVQVVTLVDARGFIEDYGDGRALVQRLTGDAPDPVELLLVRQVLAATVVVLHKADRVPDDALSTLADFLHRLHPAATVLAAERGEIEDAFLLERHTPLDPLRNVLMRLPQPTGPPVVSRVVRDVRPLHPGRLWQTVQRSLPRALYRSKGILHLASRPNLMLTWQQTGGQVLLGMAGYWKAALLHDPHLLAEERDALSRSLTHPVWGDRHCEIVLIGTMEAVRTMERHLHTAWLTLPETQAWQHGASFPDPWPTMTM